MYFRDLAIGASEFAQIPKGHSEREFNLSTHAVQEIFLAFMPRKYRLDGMAKMNLELGPKGAHAQYEQVMGVNLYFVEDFSFRAYFAASTKRRDEMLLSVLEKGLLDIAARSGADPQPIRRAIRETRACGCEHRYVISRISRLTRSRRLKLNVFRHVFHGGESWGVDITNRKGEVLNTLWIAKRTNWFRASSNYRRSVIKGNNFVVLDWIGRQTFKLNVVELERRLIGVSSRT
jgi:hypothetical protein